MTSLPRRHVRRCERGEPIPPPRHPAARPRKRCLDCDARIANQRGIIGARRRRAASRQDVKP